MDHAIPALAYVLYRAANRGERENQKTADRPEASPSRRRYPTTVSLVNRQHHTRRDQQALWLILSVAVLLLMAAVFIKVFDLPLDPAAWEWGKVVGKFRTKLAESPWETLYLLLPLLLGVIQAIFAGFNRRSRLVLSERGVEFSSGWPVWLQWFQPSWRIAWSELETVCPSTSNTLGVAVPGAIELITPQQTRRVLPYRWIDPNEPETEGWRERMAVSTGADTAKLILAMDRSLFINYLRDAGITVDLETIAEGTPKQFALESNVHTRAAMVILAILALYVLIDVFVLPETYADFNGSFTVVYTVLGLATAAAAFGWLMATRVPMPESITLALLIGLVIGLACYPAALRLNMLTDPHGLQDTPYYVNNDDPRVVRLVPAGQGLPTIEYFKRVPYWTKFDKGDIFTVKLRKGMLGFYQFHQKSIIEDIRRFEGRAAKK